MDPGDIMWSELSQSPKHKYHDLTYRRLLGSPSSHDGEVSWRGQELREGAGESVFNRYRASVEEGKALWVGG